ncbi:MAG: glyceraldehyde-3-phosphate dehydrogenase [Thermoleophilia bacterium]|nr:glyceraldehyde-3-phosphate dehydrogenase [Thermoleophilia bacterium]
MSGAARGALGINGLGRIGKLTVWHHAARKHFPHLVVNLGRGVGKDLEAVCDVIEHDSTYGRLHRFLHGLNGKPCVHIIDRDRKLIEVNGMPVTLLQEARDPRDIAWRDHGVRVVVDTTGAFDDPTRPVDDPKGSLRGHLWAGAEKVIYSAAFKSKQAVPDDVTTLVFGINHEAFDPGRHHLVSAASCTTTALAHMVKPLLESLGARSFMTASMSTVHAATNSQSLLDSVPKAGATDLRKTRSALNSIILTSTNAATALEQTIPDIGQIGFMADSVRIPLPTESLIILNVTVQSPQPVSDGERPAINRDTINDIYREAAGPDGPGHILCSERQNVPADVSGWRAAVVIESVETHTRTGFVTVDLATLPGVPYAVLESLEDTEVRVPVTHAKIFGWYDNEYGSYTNMLGDLTCHVADRLD